MRQSRHLGLVGNNKMPINELACEIALTLFENCVIDYSQERRRKFFDLINTQSNWEKLKSFKQYKDILSNLNSSNENEKTCDCSSYIDMIWYLAHYTYNEKSPSFAYSSNNTPETARKLRANLDTEQTLKFNNTDGWTTYDFHNITKYQFQILSGGIINLKKGDIIIEHGRASADYEGNTINGIIGHTKLYLGKIDTQKHPIAGISSSKNYTIECGGDERGTTVIKKQIRIKEHGGTLNTTESDESIGFKSYVLRKNAKSSGHPSEYSNDTQTSIKQENIALTTILYKTNTWSEGVINNSTNYNQLGFPVNFTSNDNNTIVFNSSKSTKLIIKIDNIPNNIKCCISQINTMSQANINDNGTIVSINNKNIRELLGKAIEVNTSQEIITQNTFEISIASYNNNSWIFEGNSLLLPNTQYYLYFYTEDGTTSFTLNNNIKYSYEFIYNIGN